VVGPGQETTNSPAICGRTTVSGAERCQRIIANAATVDRDGWARELAGRLGGCTLGHKARASAGVRLVLPRFPRKGSRFVLDRCLTLTPAPTNFGSSFQVGTTLPSSLLLSVTAELAQLFDILDIYFLATDRDQTLFGQVVQGTREGFGCEVEPGGDQIFLGG
jgi:hypothetical protein